jgi:hypothetical protein
MLERLSAWCPYVAAAPETWRAYGRLLAAWMDLTDLATFKSSTLSYYEASTELRQRDLNFTRVSSKTTLVPQIQFSPVENVALEIGAMLENKANWERFSKSTVKKSFAVIEDMGFISARKRATVLHPNSIL